MSDSLRIIPLGGVGEVGKNITVIEIDDDILVVDCGLAFPEPEMLGIDLVIPDATYLAENRDRVRGIILTHGHEDHTGALPYVLPKIPGTPIYATRLTEGLVQGKLKEHKLLESTPLHVIEPGPGVRGRLIQDHAVPREPLDPRWRRLRDHHAPWHDRAHRRLQVRPHPARRTARRPWPDRRDRQPRRRVPPQRLHPRREGRLHAVRDDGRREPQPARGRSARPRDRRDLRKQHRSRPAGDRRGVGKRSQDGRAGAQHGAEHGDRARARLPRRPRRHLRAQGPAAAAAEGRAGRHDDRLAG